MTKVLFAVNSLAHELIRVAVEQRALERSFYLIELDTHQAWEDRSCTFLQPRVLNLVPSSIPALPTVPRPHIRHNCLRDYGDT